MSIPLQTRLPQTFRIKAIKQETEPVRTLTFATTLQARPGQFAMVWVPGIDEIPLSVAYDDGKGELRFTFSVVGDATKALAAMQEGDLVGLRGPFGTHYEWEKKQHLILVAGGYGAAPMYFTAHEALRDGCTLDIVIGARNKDLLLYVEELQSLPHTKLHIATDDGSAGHKGFNVDILEQLLTTHPSVPDNVRAGNSLPTTVLACGPERMLLKVLEVTLAGKIPAQLSFERYMKCGFGLCGNCVADPQGICLCKEGPVLSGELAQKVTEFGKYHRDELGKKKAF